MDMNNLKAICHSEMSKPIFYLLIVEQNGKKSFFMTRTIQNIKFLVPFIHCFKWGKNDYNNLLIKFELMDNMIRKCCKVTCSFKCIVSNSYQIMAPGNLNHGLVELISVVNNIICNS